MFPLFEVLKMQALLRSQSIVLPYDATEICVIVGKNLLKSVGLNSLDLVLFHGKMYFNTYLEML